MNYLSTKANIALAVTPCLCRFPCWYGIIVALLTTTSIHAQEDRTPLRLQGLYPAEFRANATEAWVPITFTLTNFDKVERYARVAVFFAHQPDLQYCRDLWVPAESTINGTVLLGPPELDKKKKSVEIQYHLYEKKGNDFERVRQKIDGPVPSRLILYRPKEPSTAVLADPIKFQVEQFGKLPAPPPATQEILQFVKEFRKNASLSQQIHLKELGTLAADIDYYDAIDHFVVATKAMKHNSPGLVTLRNWLERGGTIWVMLDHIDPNILPGLLGDAYDFTIVDTVSLSSWQIKPRGNADRTEKPRLQTVEQPVDFVRVQLPPEERITQSIDGWPVLFSRSVGKGHVVFSTLGARGWTLPVIAADANRGAGGRRGPTGSKYIDAFRELANEIVTIPTTDSSDEIYQSQLAAEIGYTVLGWTTVAGIVLAAVLCSLLLGWSIRSWRQKELLGLIGPAVAVGAAVSIYFFGTLSQEKAESSIAYFQIVETTPGLNTVDVQGHFAYYQRDAEGTRVVAENGGMIELPNASVQGKIRRRVQTDMGNWYWENLTLPVGVHFGTFSTNVTTPEPSKVVVRFAEDQSQGKLDASAFGALDDIMLHGGTGRHAAIQLQSDGSFLVSSVNALAPGHYVADGLLTDQQQRREVYLSETLKRKRFQRLYNNPILLAWGQPLDIGLKTIPPASTIGNALIVVPVEIAPVPAGESITIPSQFINYRRVFLDGLVMPAKEANNAVDMRLRFQLPREVLPINVKEIRIMGKIKAPSRKVVLSAVAGNTTEELRQWTSPLDPFEIKLSDEKYLQTDENGGLFINLNIGDLPARPGASVTDVALPEPWTIEYLEMEVRGVTLPGD